MGPAEHPVESNIMTRITLTHRRIRIALWTGAIAIAVLVAGFAVLRSDQNHAAQTVYHGEANIRSEFSLVDHHGQAVTQEDFAGRWQLVFFGFTHCPDICPTSLAYMDNVLELLGPDADQIAPLFVTVDPERDTPEVLKDYVANFHPQLIGLTGSQDQIAKATDAFKVYNEKLPAKTGPHRYTVAHAGHFYLMNRDGGFEAVFLESEQPAAEMAEQISMRIENERETR
ncbi:SCO family protein [Sulfitobacter sp. M13]